MSDVAVSRESLLGTFPAAMASCKKTASLAGAAASALSQGFEDTAAAATYTRIKELPESLLDILALDFKVDWWLQSYTLEEKRRYMQSCWATHRRLGTKGVVEESLGEVYACTEVVEWSEYGGLPYHFKIKIDSSYEGYDPDKMSEVLSRVRIYKNVRSVLDGVEFEAKSQGITAYWYAAQTGDSMEDGASAEVNARVGTAYWYASQTGECFEEGASAGIGG